MKWIASLTLAVSFAGAASADQETRPAPELRMVDSSGKAVKLGDYRGKVVVMQFLYTTCMHCQATARMLSRLQDELGPQGLQVIGVAFNPEAQRAGVVDEFVKANGIDFPVGPVSLDTALGYLGISAIERFVVPQIVVVDRHGMIRAQSSPQGTNELQDENYLRTFLGGLLKKSSTTARRD